MVNKCMLDDTSKIELAFVGTNFGFQPGHTPLMFMRKIIAESVFQLMAGYAIGHTMSCILTELGATTKNSGMPVKAARRWIYHYFNRNDKRA